MSILKKPTSRLKYSALLLGIFLLAVPAAPDAFAQRAAEEVRSDNAVPTAPRPQVTDAEPSARPGESHERPATPALRRAQLRRDLLQRVNIPTRHAANLSAHLALNETEAQEQDDSNTWWYVAGGAAVLGLATGAAVLLSGGDGGSGESIPLPPERP